MFNSDLDSRLGLFDAILVEKSDKCSVIEEKTQSGYARLNLSFTNPCITFKKLDDNRLGYFKQKNTADGLMIEMTPEKCRLHIFELKKTIDISSLEKMLKQFKGAYLNALAIAGYLGITYDQVLLYCGYRYDKLSQASDEYPLNQESGEADHCIA